MCSCVPLCADLRSTINEKKKCTCHADGPSPYKETQPLPTQEEEEPKLKGAFIDRWADAPCVGDIMHTRGGADVRAGSSALSPAATAADSRIRTPQPFSVTTWRMCVLHPVSPASLQLLRTCLQPRPSSPLSRLRQPLLCRPAAHGGAASQKRQALSARRLVPREAGKPQRSD